MWSRLQSYDPISLKTHVGGPHLEVALGSYVGEGQELGGEFSLAEGEVPLSDAPDVWSDGSLVLDGFSGIGVAGCGGYAHASGAPDGAGEVCRLCCSILGPSQTVQPAEV